MGKTMDSISDFPLNHSLEAINDPNNISLYIGKPRSTNGNNHGFWPRCSPESES